jgi:hypothetical protein
VYEQAREPTKDATSVEAPLHCVILRGDLYSNNDEALVTAQKKKQLGRFKWSKFT